MSPSHLPNYIRTYRKRAHLSQDDVAFLLGVKSSAFICRHEHFQQVPNLQTLLAYEILFRTPARNLFSGVHHEVERKLKQRVRLLARRLTQGGRSRLREHKLRTLEAFLKEPPVAVRGQYSS